MSLFNVVFVLGPPGSGKGTQCDLISKEFNYKHLSAGELLRKEQARKGSKYGDLIDGHIRNGTIVPVEITCQLLENAMTEFRLECAGFLVDGFPRNQNNVDGWQKQMASKANVQCVLFLSCPENICMERCLGRGQGRTDDNELSFRKRVQTYLTQTMPIIDYYEKLNLVQRIDSSNRPEQVFIDVAAAFKKICNRK